MQLAPQKPQNTAQETSFLHVSQSESLLLLAGGRLKIRVQKSSGNTPATLSDQILEFLSPMRPEVPGALERKGDLLSFRRANFCNGQIVGQPRKWECRQNVRKMSKNVRKMSKNCPEGLKTQLSDIFWTIFAYLVDAFVW